MKKIGIANVNEDEKLTPDEVDRLNMFPHSNWNTYPTG